MTKNANIFAQAIEPALAPQPVKPAAARGGTKLIGGHFPPAVAQQLRLIAAEKDATIQSLLAEALDDLFEKNGKARIASL